jgi:hypothetical protein
MQVWEEIEYSEELDSSSTDAEEEDELTGEDLLRDLDKAHGNQPTHGLEGGPELHWLV